MPRTRRCKMSSAPVPDAVVSESSRILSTLNWLRAGVLGANDGIVSTAAIIFGVAGACAAPPTPTPSANQQTPTAGVAMGLGEWGYVSSPAHHAAAKHVEQRSGLVSHL